LSKCQNTQEELFEFIDRRRIQGRIFTGLLNTLKDSAIRLLELKSARRALYSPSEGERKKGRVSLEVEATGKLRMDNTLCTQRFCKKHRSQRIL
jgi:hypothetical protein